jgi:glutathione S-transferase
MKIYHFSYVFAFNLFNCNFRMAPLILYHSQVSPFSRSVLLLMRYLKLDVEVKHLNLQEKEQFSEEFLKINPQHTVPTIDDGGFYLWESRAILSYLMETRAPHLLPTSPKEKAILNQRLHFELGGLTNKFVDLLVSVVCSINAFMSLLVLN